MRRPLILFALTAVALFGILVEGSSAVFTSSSTSSVAVTTDTVQSWLQLYSQATDPDHLTGYWQKAPTTTPAATGTDTTLSVDLGSYARSGNIRCNRVFTIKAPTTLPVGSSMTVTAALQPDASSGFQPINSFGFGAIGNNGRNNPVTVSASQKYQANLRINLIGATAGRSYYPRVTVTVTYSGMTATYYQYTVPVTVTAQ